MSSTSGDEKCVGFGILGCADIAKKLVRSINMVPGIEVCAVGSRSLEKAKLFAEETKMGVNACTYGSYEEVLDDASVDVVYIPLPTSLHTEWVQKAVAKGKHILLEKPPAMNGSDLDKMLAACEAAGVQYMDGTMWLHNPRSAQIKKVIESQKVGQVTRVNALFYFMGDEDFLANNIRVKPGLDGLGCLGDLGWYCIGAALWAFDYDLPHIIAAHPGPTRNIDGVVISCGASMSWKDGRSAVLNFGFDNHFREVLILGGTKGVVTLEDFVIPLQEDKCSFRIDSKGGLAENATKCTTEFSRHEVQLTLPQEALMLQQFASIVQGVKSGTQAPDAYWPSVSRKTQQVMDAVQKSLESGSPVNLV